MTDDELFEKFKQSDFYIYISKNFDEIIYDKNIEIVKHDNVYIYCNANLPEYNTTKEKKVLDCETRLRVKNTDIFQATITFYSKNQYIGCYNNISNILYLVDLPIPENADKNKFDDIIGTIQGIKEGEIRSIKKEFLVRSKSKMMFGDKIYDLITSRAKLSPLDKLLRRTPERCIRKDGVIYDVILSNEKDIGLDAYKRELSEKAQKLLAKFRQKYYDDTISFKETYRALINANVPMPQFDPEEVVKNGLMMTSKNGNILYLFRVDIEVHTVISESSQRYAKIPKPIRFDDGLLTIKTTPMGSVIDIKFKHEKRHFHTDPSGGVCLGDAMKNILKNRIKSLDDILKLKNRIVDIMSVCNVSSMFTSAYRSEEILRLIKNAKLGSLNDMVGGVEIDRRDNYYR